jgi:uncharacterized membrane protein
MLGYLVRGLPGHPLHPPLTDATIGSYTFATIAAILSAIGVAEDATAKAWWLAVIVALCWTVLTALTGLADWLQISRGTPLWRTATFHALVNLAAGGLFALAAVVGHDDGWRHGAVTTWPFLLTIVGFATLMVGGWLGGTVVFVHGMRVLELQDEPTRKAVAPYPTEEKKEAAEA